jgi:general secretion pathway protein K
MNSGSQWRVAGWSPYRRRQRGVALLLVLWLLVLLSVVALSFSNTARTQALLARNLHDNSQARWLADGGVRLAVRRLWLADEDSGPAVNGQAGACRIGPAALAVAIQNVSGLIDLNLASPPVLENLFAAAGVDVNEARRLAAATSDFRDPDSRVRPDGAEAEDYAAAGLPYGPKNNLFQAVEELEQVLGMPSWLASRLRTALTVHSGRPQADPRLAPPLVRQTYGWSPESAPALAGPLPPRGESIFNVTVTARTGSGAWFTRDAVLAVTGGPYPAYRVLRWGRPQTREITLPDTEELPSC